MSALLPLSFFERMIYVDDLDGLDGRDDRFSLQQVSHQSAPFLAETLSGRSVYINFRRV